MTLDPKAIGEQLPSVTFYSEGLPDHFIGGFVNPTRYKWEMVLHEGGLTLATNTRPNPFHRLMQRWFFGFYWRAWKDPYVK